MNPVDQLTEYLSGFQSRWRWNTWLRTLAAAALAAAILTVIGAAITHAFDFSQLSITWVRWALFLGLASIAALLLVGPLMRLNPQNTAKFAEERFPELNQRLLTFVDRQGREPGDPFLPLLASEASGVVSAASPSAAFPTWMFGLLGLATILGVGSLSWMVQSGPGWLGQGAGLLWTGESRLNGEKALYQLVVEPGNITVRKGGDQPIRARLLGLTLGNVQLHTLSAGGTKWESTSMQSLPDSSTFEFLFAGMSNSLEYYVTAGPLKSPTYKITVLELPNVREVKLKLIYPEWTGMPPADQDTSADVRAVAGTKVRVQVIADRAMPNGLLRFSNGGTVDLKPDAAANTYFAEFTVDKEGVYSVATKEGSDLVRLTEDYFIEPIAEQAPEIKILKPGSDIKLSPIEEVAIQVQASDDFGLREVKLNYSVNGGPDQSKVMNIARGSREGTANLTLELEDFKLVPGDIVSIWATATDSRQTVQTDIRFLTAQPFERNVTQSQAAGGGGGGGEQEAGISERQKEIIAATWNSIRKPSNNKDVAQFLSEQQSKLSEQTKSLSRRMKSRELSAQSQDFKKFAEYLDLAAGFMDTAKGNLGSGQLKTALPDEQKALQNIERAEALFKDIQVQMQRQQGGGGGQSAGRDLSSLFDMELDTEKNQYETGRSNNQEQQSQEIDKALERLKELARRQKELAERAQKEKLNFQQKYEQDMLRREAEELRKQLEQMAKQNQDQNPDPQANGQKSQQASSGQQSGSQQSSSQQSQQNRQQQNQQQNQQQQSGQQQRQGQQGGQQSQSQGGQQQQAQGQQQQGQPQTSGEELLNGRPRRRSFDQQQDQQQAQQQRKDTRYGANSQMNAQTQARLQESLNRLDQAIKDMKDAQQNQANARRAAERLQEMSNSLGQTRQQEAAGQVRNMADQARQLAEQQRDFERRLGEQFSPENQAKMGMGSMEARRTGQGLAQEKLEMKQRLEQLEVDLQRAIRQMQAQDPNTASRMKQSLGEMQQNDTNLDMQAVAQYLRRGLGQMAQQRDAKTTRSLNRLADGLAQAQREAGKSPQQAGQQGNQDSGTQQALNRVEELRRQLEQMSRQGQNQGQNQGQQPGQQQSGQQQRQPGQQPGQQQGQQQGQQSQGQQPGQQGQQQGQNQGQAQGGPNQQGAPSQGQNAQANQPGGQQPGQQGRTPGQAQGQTPGQDPTPKGGRQSGGGSYNAMNRGDQRAPDAPANPQMSPQQLNQELAALSRQLSGDRESSEEVRKIMQQVSELDSSNFGQSQELAARIAQQLLPQVERLELQLRKKADPNGVGQVRVGQRPAPPTGFAEAVAEYFRRLSKGS